MMTSADPPKAFLCHSSADKPLVEGLATGLRANGIDAWFDKWEILPGDSLRRKIDAGIAGAQFFFVVLTPNSLGSAWVQKELDAALVHEIEGRCRLVPLVSGVADSSIPMTLRGSRWLRLDGQTVEEALDELTDLCFGISRRPELGNPPPQARVSPGRRGGRSLGSLSEPAGALAKILNHRSVTGIDGDDFIAVQEIEEVLGWKDEQVEMYVDELHERGLVRRIDDANSPIGFHGVMPTRTLFIDTDAEYRGWRPREDALAIADLIQREGEASPDALCAALGWEPRRFNPAAYCLVGEGLADGLEGNHPSISYLTLRLTPKGKRAVAVATPQSSRPRIEKWVDHEYPAAAGIVAEEAAKGRETVWCPESKIARRVDVDGYEVVERKDSNGGITIFRVKDLPENLTLLSRKAGG